MGYGPHVFACAPDPNLLCPVCGGVLEQAVVTACGHTFCRDCLLTWLAAACKTSDSQHAKPKAVDAPCPECRAPVHPGDVRNVIALKNLILSLATVCAHASLGCQEVIPLERAKRHATECRFAAVSCSRCSQKLLRKDLVDHIVSSCSLSSFSALGNQESSTTNTPVKTSNVPNSQPVNLSTRQTSMHLREERESTIVHVKQSRSLMLNHNNSQTNSSICELTQLLSRSLSRPPSDQLPRELFDRIRKCYEAGMIQTESRSELTFLLATATCCRWLTDTQRLRVRVWQHLVSGDSRGGVCFDEA